MKLTSHAGGFSALKHLMGISWKTICEIMTEQMVGASNVKIEAVQFSTCLPLLMSGVFNPR